MICVRKNPINFNNKDGEEQYDVFIELQNPNYKPINYLYSNLFYILGSLF